MATYVLNVINAAGASGASMNALLKGQALATARDSYFSDPALGGNRIGAPAPIGAVTIDLTRICASYATGAGCAAYENSTAAFGGAACQSVSQILSYASKQSNSGGGIWYGNLQATQKLAKDAFDAVNRQQVFGCL